MRIYADFNGLHRSPRFSNRQVVPLDTFGSLCDLAYAGIVLSEGTQLTIYDQSDEREDLEADAVARFDADHDDWVAEIGEEGYRYVPTQEARCHELVCVACRAELGNFIEEQGLREHDRCPNCGTQIWSPILPPGSAGA